MLYKHWINVGLQRWISVVKFDWRNNPTLVWCQLQMYRHWINVVLQHWISWHCCQAINHCPITSISQCCSVTLFGNLLPVKKHWVDINKYWRDVRWLEKKRVVNTLNIFCLRQCLFFTTHEHHLQLKTCYSKNGFIIKITQ